MKADPRAIDVTASFFPLETQFPLEVHTMYLTQFPKPYYPYNDVPDEFEPGFRPAETDKGPTLPLIPVDPEHERVINPGANPAWRVHPTYRQAEIARCP